ncbi:MAG: acylneuraminate cytidylyltransferase family protein [Bacteroidia bacterium]
MSKLRVLAVIPGRGGSKGVKDKNIREIAGKPLIAYAIECASEASKVDFVLVNTDSANIAEVARKHGAQVMMRPAALATDESPMVPVLLHVLEQMEERGEVFDILVLLQITSPIRTGRNVDEVIEMFETEPDLPAVISVVPMDDVHPARMYKKDHSNWMEPLIREWETARRQDIPPVYYRNGCIYAVRIDEFKRSCTLMPEKKKAYVMPSAWLANVDDERDMIITEALLKAWHEGKLG